MGEFRSRPITRVANAYLCKPVNSLPGGFLICVDWHREHGQVRRDCLTSLWGPGGASIENAFITVGYLAIGLGFLGSPQVFVRFMSIRDERQIRSGRWVASAFTLLTDAGAVLAGMFGSV